MKQTAILAVLLFTTALGAACGGGTGGASKIDIKVNGKDVSLSVKSSGSDKNVKTFTAKDGTITTANSFYALMANYDMDTASVGAMKKPLTSPDQVRVMLQLIGEEGTDQKSELKAGTYKASPAEKYMKVDSLTVTTFADGKETNTTFDTSFSGSKITGSVNVTSVTADAVTGTIDVTDGDKSVKGPFTSKIAAKK